MADNGGPDFSPQTADQWETLPEPKQYFLVLCSSNTPIPIVFGLWAGWRPQTLIPLYVIGQQRFFWIPGMGVFELHNTKKKFFGFRTGAPNARTTVPHRPAKVFLNTWDGGV